MDALSEILHSVKLEGAVFDNAVSSAPGGFRSCPSCEVGSFLGKGARHVIMYHLVTAGRARVQVEQGAQGAELCPGDIVIFPHGDAHVISNGSPSRIVNNAEYLKEIFERG